MVSADRDERKGGLRPLRQVIQHSHQTSVIPGHVNIVNLLVDSIVKQFKHSLHTGKHCKVYNSVQLLWHTCVLASDLACSSCSFTSRSILTRVLMASAFSSLTSSYLRFRLACTTFAAVGDCFDVVGHHRHGHPDSAHSVRLQRQCTFLKSVKCIGRHSSNS